MGSELASLFVEIGLRAPELDRVAARAKRSIEAIEQQAEMLGENGGFDAAAAKAKELDRTIAFMAKKAPAELAKVSGEMKQLVAETQKAQQMAAGSKVMRGLEGRLETVGIKAQLMGRGYNVAADKAAALQDAIVDLSRTGIDRNDASMRNLVSRYQQATREAQTHERATRLVTTAQQRMAMAATAAATAISAAAVAGAAQGVKSFAAREQRDIAFTGLFRGDTGQAQKALDVLWQKAKATPFEFAPLADMTQRFMSAKVAWQDIPTIITSIGDAAARTGKGSEAIDRISNALIQMLQKGKVSSEEMTQQLGELVPAWQILADEMKTTIPSVQKMVEDGLIPADRAFRALIVGMEKWAPNAMADQIGTLNTKWSSFADALRGERGLLSEIGGLLVDTFDIKDVLDNTTSAVENLQAKIEEGAGWDALIPQWVRDLAAGVGIGGTAYGISSLATSIQGMTVAAGGAGILAGVGSAAPFLPWVVGTTAAIVALSAVVDAIEDTDKAAQNIITGKNGVSPWSIGPIADLKQGPPKAPPPPISGTAGLAQLEAPKIEGISDFKRVESRAAAAAAAVEKAWRDAQRNIAAGSQTTASKLAVDNFRTTVIVTNQSEQRWKALAKTYNESANAVNANPMNPVDMPALDKAQQAWADRYAGMAAEHQKLVDSVESDSLATAVVDEIELDRGQQAWAARMQGMAEQYANTQAQIEHPIKLDTAGAIESLKALEQEALDEGLLLNEHLQAKAEVDVSEAVEASQVFKLGIDAIIAEGKRLKQNTSMLFQETAEGMIRPIYDAADELVFHSIVPDMVDLVIANFQRMSRESIPEGYKLGQELAKAGFEALKSADMFAAAGDKVKTSMAATEAAIVKALPAPLQMVYAIGQLRNMLADSSTNVNTLRTDMQALETAAYATSTAVVAWLDASRAARQEAGAMQTALDTLSDEFGGTSEAVRTMQMELDSMRSAGQAVKKWTTMVLSGLEQQTAGYYMLEAAKQLALGNIAGFIRWGVAAAGVIAAFEGMKSLVDSAIPDVGIVKGSEELKRLAEQLETIDKIEAARGERYDELQAKADAYKRALDDLARAGASDDVIKDIASKLKGVEDQIAARDIPGMASGGHVDPKPGGTIVRLAEAGFGEWVVPDKLMQNIERPIEIAPAQMGRGGVIWNGDINFPNARFDDPRNTNKTMEQVVSILRRNGVLK